MPLVGPTKLIWRMKVDDYQWHEFYPNGKLLLCFVNPGVSSLRMVQDMLIMNIFDVATHNFGVIIAIWAPVVLVSGSKMQQNKKLLYSFIFW